MAVLLALSSGCSEQGEQPVTAHPQTGAGAQAEMFYVGSAACAGCHAEQFRRWQRSHHALAMQPATARSVAAEFNGQRVSHDTAVITPRAAAPANAGEAAASQERARFTIEIEDGAAVDDYAVRYTFGIAPLQQYLVDVGGGRLQALDLAWDNRPAEQGGQRWFDLRPQEVLTPGDPLHWSGAAGNWNFMCADCHSTGLRKNYDVRSDSYKSSFEEVTVGCEACHGPASAHVETGVPLFRGNGPEQIPACAPCHSRRSQLAEGFQPGDALLDHYQPALLDQGIYHADGQIQDEVYVYGSFLQSAMHEAGVVCSDCHEPHSAQLRLPANAVCTQCHNTSGHDRYPTAPRGDFASPSHHFHNDEVGCVDCHMPATTYMQIDPRRDHSFRIPRPDLSEVLGVPNPCAACHQQGDQWAAAAIARHTGRAPKPHHAALIAAGRRGEPAAEQQLARLAQDETRPGIVRATAMTLLAAYDRHLSSVALEQGLRDVNPLVRIGAVRGARRWPPTLLYQNTRHLLSDPLLAVRMEAAHALVGAYPGLPADAQRALQPHMLQLLQHLQFNADDASGQSAIAAVQLALGNAAAAEHALQHALKLNPSWVPALVNLADLYRATGRDQLAREPLRRARQLAPENTEVLLAQALWLVRQQDAPAALGLLKRAWELQPSNSRYAYVYMAALHAQGQLDAALEVADQALALRDDAQLRSAAAGIARQAGNTDRARSYLVP